MKISERARAFIKDNLWTIFLDILAVNASYFLALLLRYYVNWSFRPMVMEVFLPVFEHFAPWYTLISICIFALFRLYNGIWRYAGLNDFNRIILANISTAIFQFLGSTVFYTRMPMTYYFLGAALQFSFIVVIRFGYRIYTEEKASIVAKGAPTVNAIVIGLGEIGRMLIRFLASRSFDMRKTMILQRICF